MNALVWDEDSGILPVEVLKNAVGEPRWRAVHRVVPTSRCVTHHASPLTLLRRAVGFLREFLRSEKFIVVGFAGESPPLILLVDQRHGSAVIHAQER